MSKFDHVPQSDVRAMTAEIIIDARSAARGSMADWVAAFAEVWSAPRERLVRLMALLSEDVVLIAPRGKAEGRRAFARAFRAMPDLRAEIHRWPADQDVLFIKMSFFATIGGRTIAWRNVDRFLFRNGVAVERVAFWEPARVRRAFLSKPRGWFQLVRLRAGV